MNCYGDNFVVRDQTNTLPGGPIKGMNLAPDFVGNAQTDWPALWNRFITSGGGGQGGVYSQIQMAKSAGCNCIRLIGGSKGVWQGVYTQSAYLTALRAIISYCKSQNLYFYLTDQAQAGYDPTGNGTVTQATLFSSITSLAVATVQAVIGYPNILGYDIRQENDQDIVTGIGLFNHTTTQTGTFSMTNALELVLTQQCISAVRAIVPNMPLTCSIAATANGTWNPAFLGIFAYLYDFIDCHVYYSAAAGQSNSATTGLYTNTGTSGKKLFIGEFGDNMALTESGGASRNTILNNIWTNVVQATYTGQPGCFGGEWWASIPQNTSGGANDYGLWDGTWNGTLPVTGARNPEETTYAGLSAQSVSFSSGRRRRR